MSFFILLHLLPLIWIVNATHFRVPESAPIGHRIGFVGGGGGGGDSASASASQSKTTPQFLIIFPDEQTSKFLKVDESNGEITTIANLDYEKRSRFEIVAVETASSGGDSSSSSSTPIDIVIDVDDENDNSPKFAVDFVKLNISEFAQIGTSFALPIVTDGDGPMFDVHKFSIIQGNVNNVFKLSTRRINEQLQADLIINGQLDREFRDKYELLIEAEDGGKPARSDQLRLQIEILDANDNAPIFKRSRYTASVSANVSIGSTIITVDASDADIGENSRIRYSIKKTASPSNGNFRVGESSGVITTTAHLLPSSTHDLIVVASDHGSPPLSTTAVVTITVLGSSLSAPALDIIWLVDTNTAHLPENTTIGSIVARVSISRDYRDAHLKLHGCSALCPQQTDTSHVYLLLLCGMLDRETIDEYHLKFVLEKNGATLVEHPQLLTIGDINDNSPQWHSSQIHITLNRSSGGGSRTLIAKDPDHGVNGWIKYSILDTDLVSIDKETGRIFVPKPIDCRHGAELKFRVRAEDGATPPLFSDLQVIADLIDETSKPPQFEKTLWQVEIAEDTPIGTCLIKVFANSTQCGSSKRIRYSFAQSDDDEFLSIDSISGTICIIKMFDYEVAKSHQTTILATNSNAETATSLISINLIDVNDNWPIFYPADYQLTIRDGATPLKTPLLIVSASDADDGVFGDVTYQMLSDSASFSIDAKSGEIFAKTTLNKGRYHLIVSASDGGGQTAENPANIHINVIDVNAKAPEFTKSKYEIRTTEDILPGIAIGSVAAISDRRVRYSIYSGDVDHNFSIDEDTGKIYVTRYLDADVHDSVLLNVQAATIDGGVESNQTQVLIHIDDHNDNPPQFASNQIEVTIREDVAINEPFYVIHATDRDKKNNGRIRYSVISSHPGSSIQIDATSGQVSTGSSFDYETIRDFKVRIKATDGGLPPKSSNMTLFVHIADVNDNRPIFDATTTTPDGTTTTVGHHQHLSVVENSPPKSFVGKIVAHDADSGENGQVAYRITNGSEYFGIDEKLGTIYTKRMLDRESLSHVDITIRAEDKGMPSLSASMSCRVVVLDVNDNAPSCHSVTPIVVGANAPPSTPIGTIVATDPDKGLNGSVLYRAQLQSSLFVVKANGDVYLRRQLNTSEETHQRLSVIVSDQGTPRKSAVCHVPIRVVAQAASSSIVIHQPIQRIVEIPEKCNISCRLIRINASNVDQWLIQSSEISNHFLLRNAILTMLHRPAHRAPYSLTLILSDRQGRQKHLNLRLIESGEMINRHAEIRFLDTVGIGTKVGKLGETAADGTAFYRKKVKSGDVVNGSTCPLEVDETSGSLYLAEGMRRRKLPSSSENISCFYEKFNTTIGSGEEMRIDVKIDRTKVEKPKFETNQLMVTIKEDTPIGTVITVVNATSDDDTSIPINYRFDEAIDEFVIDQFTGEISLVDQLHWHKKSIYHLTVEAFTIGRSTSMLITIYVEDQNDHSPRIISPNTVWMPTILRKGLIIHQILSIDEDQGSETSYQFTSTSSDASLSIDSKTGAISIKNVEAAAASSLMTSSSAIIVRAVDKDDATKFDEQQLEIRFVDNTRLKSSWHFFDEPTSFVEVVNREASQRRVVKSYRLFDDDVTLRLMPTNQYFEMDGGDVVMKADAKPGVQHFLLTVLAEANTNQSLDVSSLEINIRSTSSNIVDDDASPPLKIASTSCGLVEVEENQKIDTFKRIMIVGASPTTSPTFRLQGVNEKFRIDAKTGQISMSQKLDREASQEHLLVVIVDDGRTNDSCTVRVLVTDINDNAPQFDASTTPTTIVINETTRLGDVLHRFTATDTDIGVNGKFSFDLIDDPSKSLDIVPETGALVVRRRARLDDATWHIKIAVFDHGTPSLSTSRRILIKNLGVETIARNATPIAFLRQSYVATLDESQQRGQYVTKLETSEDVSSITYSIVEGNIDSAFVIDSDGVIRSNVELDKEIIDQYNIKVIGIGKEFGQISTRIDILINNLNDNIPSFPAMKPRKISEDLPSGSYIATIAAKDVDQLSPLQYFLLNKLDQFELDRFTGVVHLLKRLDYESEKEHVLRIRVTDGEFEALTNLTILVADVNDNFPIFDKKFYNLMISPTSSDFDTDVPLATIHAVDADDHQNSQLIYSIDSTDVFRIDPTTGELYLRFMPPTGDRYLISVSATDQGQPSHTSSTVVRVTIGGEESATLATQTSSLLADFEKNEYRFEVEENRRIGFYVGNLTMKNRRVESLFKIGDSDASKMFRIDNFGRIFVAANLDREIKDFYSFEVEVDNEMMSIAVRKMKCHVSISILDQNDNRPTFVSDIVHISLKDAMVHGQIVGKLSATDDDEGDNGKVRYRLISGNDYNILSINADTGSIAFNEWNDSQLDDYPNATWQILAEAKDHGNPFRSSIATIIVTLKMSSWSGSAPFFVLPTYDIHVLENAPINSIIETVRASNRLGIPSTSTTLFYSLKNHQMKASIDVKTGAIRLKTHLDWESEQLISMFLSVSDGNGRSAVVPLKIIVEPVDEFAPVFAKPNYRMQIPISTSVGDVVGQLQAIDEDGGVHGVVRYSIIDRQSTIRLDESTGIVTLAKNLEGRRNLTVEQVNVVAYSGPNRQTKTTIFLEIGPFETKTSSIPRLLHSRSVQIAAASLIFLLILLILLIFICMCRSRLAKSSESSPTSTKKKASLMSTATPPKPQVYSVQTGEIRVLTGDLTISQPSSLDQNSAQYHQQLQQQHHQHRPQIAANSLTSSVSTSSEAMRTRSQIDSGIDPDNVSINSSVTDYLVSIGVNANPIPPRVRHPTTYDSLINDYIYARVEDCLPPGPINLSSSHQNSLLRQKPPQMFTNHHLPNRQAATARGGGGGSVPTTFEPLTELFGEMRRQNANAENNVAQRKEYVQVEI